MKLKNMLISLAAACCALAAEGSNSFGEGESLSSAQKGVARPCVSGVYPHLAFWNKEGECGTGALVEWAGKFWAISYGPHCDGYSSDKLYEIDPKTLEMKIRPESVGGTHADRLIHEESNQLFIGCYAIDSNGAVRAISREKMHGRITGAARSILTPEKSVYFATMEEGLYEVDAKTLEVKEIIRDGNLKDNPGAPRKSNLHGYHGKGFYTGFGKAFYANNGVNHPRVAKDPTLKSGALAFWKPGDADWTAIRICQFTEITGKDGIRGSKDPENTPLWALGWDAKSVILMLNEADKWSSFRLPKASHSYDGSHGWNTEWPRIRDIGKKDYLMTMHGAFWKFPPAFSGADTSGIRMRSSYLKVIGDFCRFNDVVALGCDDSAKKEFFNSRPLKGKNVAPLNSNSNLWFVSDSRLDNLGPKFGRGSVFLREDVKAGIPSDAMLTGGFGNRVLVLSHQTQTPVEAEIQTSDGKGGFKISQKVLLPANSSKFIKLADAEWTRVVPKSDAKSFTAHFTLFDPDTRSAEASAIFDGVARVGEKNSSAALLRTLDINKKLMGALARARGADGIEDLGVYSLDIALNFSKNSNISKGLLAETESEPRGITYLPGAVLIEEGGKRFLLPRNGDYRGKSRFGIPRVAREVVTERDIMNCGGIFYELPAINAGGMEKIRPIAAHNLDVFDFCSYCGIMFISGISDGAPALKNPRIITSADGKLSLWAGVIDDLWKLGKPVGRGEIWHEKSVSAGEVSDALLLSGFDKKTLRAVSSSDASVDVEVDIDGTGLWVKYATYKLKANSVFEKDFDGDFCGYWVRLRSSNPSEKITAAFIYR